MGEMQGAPVTDSFLQAEPAGPGTRSRRKVFYFLDSLEVGGTETQAVELTPVVYGVAVMLSGSETGPPEERQGYGNA